MSFRFEGQHYTGFVNRVTKRATVLVEDKQGEPYINGAGFWARISVIGVVVVTVGLPINDLFRYSLVLVTVVMAFIGVVTTRIRFWIMAITIASIACFAQVFLPHPQIEEGHNVFLTEQPGSVLKNGLPADAYRIMKAQFDTEYPIDMRCGPPEAGCWRHESGPTQVFAFSADSIWDTPLYSRRIQTIDFSDPVWWGLGFINDGYNWFSDISDVNRASRKRGTSNLLRPWKITMPYLLMFQFPEPFIGSELCWQGQVLWETTPGHFALAPHADLSCRSIEPSDIGRRVFGLSISQEAPLLMKLVPNSAVRIHQVVGLALTLLGTSAILFLLLRLEIRKLRLPFILISLSLGIVLLNDASFIGGLRLFDGGNDGLFYDFTGRAILQEALAGNWKQALEGGEKVFYYGGPGLRYLRAIEHFIFGETYLGYLSLLLGLPFILFALNQKFFSVRIALAFTLIFVAIPIGALFGTTFYQYAKWAVKGFADPAAAILFPWRLGCSHRSLQKS